MSKRYDVRVILERDGDRFELWIGSVARGVVATAVAMLRTDAHRHELDEAYKALLDGKEK